MKPTPNWRYVYDWGKVPNDVIGAAIVEVEGRRFRLLCTNFLSGGRRWYRAYDGNKQAVKGSVRFRTLLCRLGDYVLGKTKAPCSAPPRWRYGKPNAVGFWLIRMKTGDHVAVQVTREEHDAAPHSEYLRIYDESGDSEELRNYQWAEASFGPIPEGPPVKLKRTPHASQGTQ